MTRYIETHPDGFIFLIPELLKKHNKLIIEAPTGRDAALLNGALQVFSFKTVLFSPQFLLLERGSFDIDAQTAFAKIVEDSVDVLIVTPLSAKMKVPNICSDEKIIFNVKNNYSVSRIIRTLSGWGYKKVPIVREPGEFAVRGDIFDISIFSSGEGIRMEFFDEELEKIHTFSTASQRNRKGIKSVTIPKLLFSSTLNKDWKTVLETKNRGLSMKEILEAEEAVLSDQFSVWDIFPLLTGDSTICRSFGGTFIRWEEIEGELYLKEQFFKFDSERNKRVKEGHFLPFSAETYFGEETTPEIKISSMFSSGKHIEKFMVNHIKPSKEIYSGISKTLKKLCTEDSSVIIFSSPNEIPFFIEEAENDNIELLYVKKLPENIETGLFYIIEKKAWFQQDSVVFIPSLSTFLISSGLFKKHASIKATKQKQAEPYFESSETFTLESLKPGEYVVHYNFGIAVYEGIEKVSSTDCLILRYDKGDKLFVPVYNMHFIYRYKYEEGVFPRISSLRTSTWHLTKSRTKKEIEAVAESILDLYAERDVQRSKTMEINTEIYREFSSQFPYTLTRDQAVSIRELEGDLAGEKITDRLLCGDVGFGKTEVAMRGCMITAANDRQSAVLTPTTVLAFQHFRTFSERFSQMPVRIGMLSRFHSPAKQKEVIKEIKEGKIDIIIGTHRLISADVKFKNLGFLVVDEEHRFGVSHKEKIKNLKKDVATLSMTATPIPRTLQMSLLGIRKVSFIKTPPGERKSTITYILNYSDEIIKEAILSELSRNGQIYFIHNRIPSLLNIKNKMELMVPGIKIGIAHGKMDEKELEKVMVNFVNREYDMLLSTTLIESGIDIPMVNTIIINRADTFGLAQLYQLRGRVGRWNREAKAYLFVPNLKDLTPDAYSRLAVIKRFDYLGSGYDVATEDLNIRGGGNILGFKQSGKLKGIGNDLYLDLLRKRIEEMQKGVPANDEHFEISSDIEAFIPENYICDSNIRVGFYKRISETKNHMEISGIKSILEEMFGKIPVETENLLFLTAIKIESLNAGAYGIIVNRNDFTLNISPSFIVQDMEKLFKLLENFNGRFSGTHSVSFPINDIKEIKNIVSELKAIFTEQAR